MKGMMVTGPGGHRARMRRRIRMAGAQSLADYELLEVLLFAAVPRRDTKPQAKALLAHFGGLEAVLDAPPEALRAAGLGPRGAAVLSCPARVAARLSHADPRGQAVLGDMAALLEHCDGAPCPDRDGVRVFYLDSARHMLADEMVLSGPAAEMCRAVLARALELHAVSLIAVRDMGARPPPPQGSAGDLRFLRMLHAHARLLGLALQDCLVRGGGTTLSMRDVITA
ncbi:JAB domain-containing protein [Komagataeibacter sp. FNDCR2]|uniref:JAB domain-containing protein n=1 Tax=Komagataeibacter sp. FNDCR2 TaxID=2878682 RepID=UPI001E3042B2|nr:JAB domain-containing protein [Komagataeibacter sp. FNDCR2]MCE2576498.1 DNA repair protein RadC [Komagataeibacter sp. FNDCR2]